MRTSPFTSTTSPQTRNASTGCGRKADAPKVVSKPPGDVARTITLGGIKRSYRIGVPVRYDPNDPTPLVMNLHGSGSNALQASFYGAFTQAAKKRDMVTITPDANGGRWQISENGTDNDFLLALVRNMKDRFCIDETRVYLVGMSLGSWKAAVTACGAPQVFAAIALVAVEVHPTDCPPIPMVAFHGTDDPIVPYGEGSGKAFPKSPNAGLPGVHKNLANWAEGNRCEPKPSISRIGSDIIRWVYRDCDADLALYTIEGGGHTWPGAKIKIGPTTQTIDATQIAFDWFDAHPRATRP